MVHQPKKLFKKVVDKVINSDHFNDDDDDDDDYEEYDSYDSNNSEELSHEEYLSNISQTESVGSGKHSYSSKPQQEIKGLKSHVNILLVISTVLLVILFSSAGFLLYRIGQLHDHYTESPFPGSFCSDDVYKEILKWQSHLQAQSESEMHEFLNTNLNKIVKVRQSLEALSSLIPSPERNINAPSKQKSSVGENSYE